MPSDVILSAANRYTKILSLPQGGSICAFDALDFYQFLVVFCEPGSPGDDLFADSRDVLLYDGTRFSTFFDGSENLIPLGAAIDAAFMTNAGSLVLSFDVPIELSNNLYRPADLVLFSAGSFSMYRDSSSVGIPIGVNTVAAGEDNAQRVAVSFDTPVTINGLATEVGDWIRWDLGGLSLLNRNPEWPDSVILHGLSPVEADSGAGAVPGSTGAPGPLLQVHYNQGEPGGLRLTWAPSCRGSDTDYAVYEGQLGAFQSHTSLLCSTGGATMIDFTPSDGNRYYLVVPNNGKFEGSYGQTSAAQERPQGPAPCLPRVSAACE